MVEELQGKEPTENTRRSYGWLIAPLIIFAGMSLMFGYALQTGDPSKLPSALIGKKAPAYDFPALAGIVRDGKPVAGFGIADLSSGEVTVVNFFASWCVPCRSEHPMLKRLKKESKVRMVGINYKDPAPGGIRFLGELGNPYDLVGTDSNGRGAIEWGVYGMPETFIIDGRGRIAYKFVGPIHPESLELKIIPAIKQARASGK